MTQPAFPDQGPSGAPALSYVGAPGFTMPAVGTLANGPFVTVTLGANPTTGVTYTGFWAPIGSTVAIAGAGTNGQSGYFLVSGVSAGSMTLVNNGATANVASGTAVPAGGAIGAGGATGPAGAASVTTLGAPLTIPAIGSTVIAQVASNAWMAVNQTLFVSDGTHFANLDVTAINVDGIHVTLLNPARFSATNPPPTTTTINMPATVTPGAGGAPLTTTLLTAFTLPAPGLTASMNLGTSATYPNGSWVEVNDGTNVAWLQSQGPTDATHITVLNPSTGIFPTLNPATGTQFALGGQVIPSGPPGGPLGTQNAGGSNYSVFPIPIATVLPNAGPLVIWTLPIPAIANGETVDLAARVTSSSMSTPDFCTNVLQMTLKNMGGTILGLGGATVASDITQPPYPANMYPGAVLANIANSAIGGVQMAIVGNSQVQISLQCPSSGATGVQASGVVTMRRSSTAASGTAVSVTNATVTTGTADGGTQTILTVSPSTNGVSTVTLDGVLASSTVQDATHLSVISGVASGAGTGAIVVTNAGGPSTGGPTWTYIDSFKAIFGVDLVGLFLPQNILHSGTTVTGWQDGSTYAQGNGTVNGTAPVYNASSSYTPSQASVTFSAGWLSWANFNMQQADPPIAFIIIGKLVNQTGNQMLCAYSGTSYFIQNQSNFIDCIGSPVRGTSSGVSGSVGAGGHLIVGYIDPNSVGAGGQNMGTIDSATMPTGGTVTGTSTAAPATAALTLGAGGGGFQQAALEASVFAVVKRKPNATDLGRVHTNIAQGIYGLP